MKIQNKKDWTSERKGEIPAIYFLSSCTID